MNAGRKKRFNKRAAKRVLSVLLAVSVMTASGILAGTDADAAGTGSAGDVDTYMGITMEEENASSSDEGNIIGYRHEAGETLATARKGSGMTLSGIDVSHYQNDAGSIDWEAVRASGIRFVIIKAGGRGTSSGSLYTDSCYEENITGAIDAGLKVGIYFFSQAVSVDEAYEEAAYAMKLANGYKLSLPIFMDYEWTDGYRLAGDYSYDERTEVVRAFLSSVASGGYSAGLYGSDKTLSTYLDGKSLSSSYRIWVARYGNAPGTVTSKYPEPYSGIYDLWQYSSKGSVSGITGNVDMDEWYSPISLVPMYRLFYAGTQEHLYTSDTNEREHLLANGWKDEGIGWYAPSVSDKPVYRMFNAGTTDHLYTADYNEYTVNQSRGWTPEGIAWYSDDGKTVPVYRQYCPYLVTGSHNYTTDLNEKNVIVASGAWHDEGVAWYAIKAGQ